MSYKYLSLTGQLTPPWRQLRSEQDPGHVDMVQSFLTFRDGSVEDIEYAARCLANYANERNFRNVIVDGEDKWLNAIATACAEYDITAWRYKSGSNRRTRVVPPDK